MESTIILVAMWIRAAIIANLPEAVRAVWVSKSPSSAILPMGSTTRNSAITASTPPALEVSDWPFSLPMVSRMVATSVTPGTTRLR
uniref:Uncharacterized protein n=1 Tax=uncultured marine group II/III euryarchaeote AD1000_92_A11 TaxID=1457826 RepID=A0A075G5I0_9EURY|nr:hypothetical protein [uncultured marine group II/III euryarchaeote AD1000_92_A11]